MKFYKVGGVNRDKIMRDLGRTYIPESHDIDYAVEADSFQDMYDYINKTGRIYLSTPEFYTIRAKMPGMGDCDFVLCRIESDYTDGRHPDTVKPGTIYDDLARRDFTMNAIAIDESGNYIDPFNGMTDIQEKIIRCVEDTEIQFTADALRMIRAVRFSVTKKMDIDTNINYFIHTGKNWDLLKSVSPDRIRDEINKMWEFDPVSTFYTMNDHEGMFSWIFKNTNVWMKASQEKR